MMYMSMCAIDTLPCLIGPSINLFFQISAPFPEEPEMTKSLVSSYLFMYLFVAFFIF